MKVLEKFQNKKVFALYLVGVLILSAGVSFAYFSANSSVTGGGSVATNTTATIKSEGVQADGNISFSNADIYPGHQAVASIRVTGTGNNTPIVFNVIFNGNNTFNTPINYTIYKVENNIDASYSCEVREGRVGLNKIYYEECTGNNIEELGTSIGSGTITQGEGKTILKSDEIILTEPDGKEIYYYVVFEYPNEEANQNDDIGSIISGNITIEEGSKYTNPNVVFVGTTTSGNNGWYKSVSLTSNITTQTGNYDVLYCVTTEDSCIPNQTASITNNSFTTALSSNANPQKLCVRITDEYNQIGEGCSEAYKVDGTNPTITTTLASSTAGSNNWYKEATIKANGSDSHSGIESIKYCTTTSSTCTPTTNVNGNSTEVKLPSNASAQKVCAQAIDISGNTSTITCSSAYSVDTTNPTVSITSTSVTENSISVTVSGNDAHSGIDQYKFSSNGGSTYTTISSTNNTYTYTFNNLNGGTTYNIAVQVVDKSGRVSSVVTKSVETERISAKDTILANYPTILTRTNFNTTVTTTTTGTIYKSADSSQYDNDGEVYYFAGNPTDNWVKFGGFYWRIIRINGDGTIRLIYQGTSANTTGTRTQTGTSSFNGSYSNNMYVGFKYTSGSVQGTGTNSTIKGVLDSWYNSNLKNYVDRIDGNAGFCNDRTLYSGSGTGTAITYYAAYYRLYANNSPSFKCSNSSDLFTLSSASKGNKALTYPIGLIAADEVVYAGGVYGQINGSYYLYTRQNYWTMSPNCFDGDYARMFFVISDGDLGDGIVRNALGVRPVINLKADTLFTGTGTTTDPYVVS